MTRQGKCGIAVLALLLLLPLLTGCWDNFELDTLFIVTGIALDKAEDPAQMDITVQIGKAQSSTGASGESSASKGNSLLLQETAGTLLEGVMEIDRSSSRSLLMQHNQILLFGKELAQMGIQDRVDLIMRDQDTRLEVLLLIADGRADQILKVQPEQEMISGVYVARIMTDLKKISPHYTVRMLDFVSRLLEETSAPVILMAKVIQEEDKQKVEIEGMAVFKGGQMVGSLDIEQTRGYIWTMGDVQHGGLVAKTELGEAVFNIVRLDTKRDVELLPTGILHVTLTVNATLEAGDLRGFKDVSSKDLLPYLREAAQEKILNQIMETFEVARSLEADIFQFGVSLHRKDPQKWREMKDSWGEHFAQTKLDVQIKVRIPSIGQTTKSLEMQEDRHED